MRTMRMLGGNVLSMRSLSLDPIIYASGGVLKCTLLFSSCFCYKLQSVSMLVLEFPKSCVFFIVDT